jgi:hypothetical protein
MEDGGMGSLRFFSPNKKTQNYGYELVSMQYKDIDDIPIIITINMDDSGDIYELDIWKVDFSPLKQFPKH